MSETAASSTPAQFDLHEIAASFPDRANTMLLDRYLVDRDESSARVFRTYQPTPAHFHVHCDEHLVVISGRGLFWAGDPARTQAFGPGTLLFFNRGTVHAMPEIHEHPVVFLAIDTPRRNPKDIVFVNTADGSPESFIAPAD